MKERNIIASPRSPRIWRCHRWGIWGTPPRPRCRSPSRRPAPARSRLHTVYWTKVFNIVGVQSPCQISKWVNFRSFTGYPILFWCFSIKKKKIYIYIHIYNFSFYMLQRVHFLHYELRVTCFQLPLKWASRGGTAARALASRFQFP